MTSRVCTTCGHVGEPANLTKGSTWIELVLWLCLIIPGLIYSIWRLSSRYDACKACGAITLIPPDSPIGKSFIKENDLTTEPAHAARKPSPIAIGVGRYVGTVAGKLFKK